MRGKRRKMSRRHSRRNFKKKSGVHKRNIGPRRLRGGGRL